MFFGMVLRARCVFKSFNWCSSPHCGHAQQDAVIVWIRDCPCDATQTGHGKCGCLLTNASQSRLDLIGAERPTLFFIPQGEPFFAEP
jgi:hypothetical protein